MLDQRANLLGVIDNMLLFRCVQIVRRLSERDRRVGVFCNISMASLEDDQFFSSFLEFIRENRDLASALIFEISVRSFNQRSDIAARNMGKLKDLGFRFSLDKGDGLNFDLQELHWQDCETPPESGPPFPVIWPPQQNLAVDPNGATPEP